MLKSEQPLLSKRLKGILLIGRMDTAIQWLMETGGPVIQYRTAAELKNTHENDLQEKVLEYEPVRAWLSRGLPHIDGDVPLSHNHGTTLHIHGSNSSYFENVVPKLVQLGLSAGMTSLDDWTRLFREKLKKEIDQPLRDPFTLFYRIIVASFLCMAGYTDADDLMHFRLNAIYEFVKEREYDMYVDSNTYSSLPDFYRHDIINPDLYRDHVIPLPWVYDIIGFAALSRDTVTEKKINAVVRWILTPGYQQLPEGYGTVVCSQKRALAMGWSVHVPYFVQDGSLENPFEKRRIIQRVELMAHFSAAQKHPWFIRCIRHLETFKTERGTYIFPKEYLKEEKSGYWNSGAYMGLGETRRKKCWREKESTFWMLKIKKTAGLM